jgi:hypothetical protein
MRACDSVTHPVVGSALYIIVTPITVRGLSPAEGSVSFVFQAVPHTASFPLTPPPRTFLS